jgi:hypothetical protein
MFFAGYVIYKQVLRHHFPFCTHVTFMHFTWISELTAIIVTHSIALKERECIYCEVRAISLHACKFNFNF